MRRSLRILLLSCLAVVLLAGSALADSGPKSQLIVKVKNAPEELYYLDLVAEGEPSARSTLSEEDFQAEMDELGVTDTALYYELLAAIPEGWHGCLSQGTDGPPIFGKLTGERSGEQMLHTFGYHGVPRTYRILLVTASGEVFLSSAYTRKVLQSSVTIDWAAKTVQLPSTWIGYVLQFLATFVPTLLIEGILLTLFGFGKQKQNWLWFILVNFITQGALALVMANNAMKHGVTGWSLLPFVLLEFIIVITEAALYSCLLRGHTKSRAVLYGLAANICSAVLGLYLAEPVWKFVVSIS